MNKPNYATSKVWGKKPAPYVLQMTAKDMWSKSVGKVTLVKAKPDVRHA